MIMGTHGTCVEKVWVGILSVIVSKSINFKSMFPISIPWIKKKSFVTLSCINVLLEENPATNIK